MNVSPHRVGVHLTIHAPRLASSGNMALCLSLFGVQYGRCEKSLKLYSKLSGAFIGCADLPCGCTNMIETLRYLQSRAATLLPSDRPFRDILLFKRDELITPFGFGYTHELTQEQVDTLPSLIKDRVDVLWDETDEYASHVVMKHVYNQCIKKHEVRNDSWRVAYQAICEELGTMCKISRVSKLVVTNKARVVDKFRDLPLLVVAKDLDFLKHTCVKHVKLEGAVPLDWTSCAKLDRLDLAYLDEHDLPRGMNNMCNLRRVRIERVRSLPDDFAMLDLERADFAYINIDFLKLVRLLSNMKNLQKLSVCDSRLDSLPTELGNLTSLTHLELRGNSLRGSIPTELGNLTNLVHLRINESASSELDMTFDAKMLHRAYVQIERRRSFIY